MKININVKLISTGLISILLFLSLILLFIVPASTRMAESLTEHNLLSKLNGDIYSSWLFLEKYYGDLRLEDNRLVDSDGAPIDERHEMVDAITERLGNVATIFKREQDDFVRLTTSIRDSRGSRILGTMLGQDSAAYDSVARGDLYVGRATILDQTYYTAYDPIKDQYGEVIGILFIGVPLTEAQMIVSNTTRRTYIRIIIFSILIALFIMGLNIVISRRIALSIRKVVEILKELSMASGDLTKQIVVKSKDEVGDLAESFNTFVQKLNTIITQVKKSAFAVNNSSAAISAGNKDLSQRTQEQASSLQEISSIIEETNSAIQSSSTNAWKANTISKETFNNVLQGNTVVEELQKAMQEITKSSNDIAEIIKTVNDISFQTNLLALNAAVEAAQAGEQGRGFAVVAAEVRSLAHRSTEAAQKIEKLIKESINRVNRGNELMATTKSVLDTIVENINATDDLVGDITNALQEKTLATKEISSGIGELNQVTQQNATIVEEIASSSESMSNMACKLSKLVNSFKLRGEQQ